MPRSQRRRSSTKRKKVFNFGQLQRQAGGTVSLAEAENIRIMAQLNTEMEAISSLYDGWGSSIKDKFTDKKKLCSSSLSKDAAALLAKWVNGTISGRRCWIELSSKVKDISKGKGGTPSNTLQKTIMSALTTFVGIGPAMPSMWIWKNIFSKPPQKVLKEVLGDLARESMEDNPETLTAEQINLALQQLSMGFLSSATDTRKIAGGSPESKKKPSGEKVDPESDSVGAPGTGDQYLHVQIATELIRLHLEGTLQIGPEAAAPASSGAGSKATAESKVSTSCAAFMLESEMRKRDNKRSEDVDVMPIDDLKTRNKRLRTYSDRLIWTKKQLKAQLEQLKGSGAYIFLGLSEDTADRKAVKRAYRKLAIRLHPDKGGDRESFLALQQAYETIQKAQKNKSKQRERHAAAEEAEEAHETKRAAKAADKAAKAETDKDSDSTEGNEDEEMKTKSADEEDDDDADGMEGLSSPNKVVARMRRLTREAQAHAQKVAECARQCNQWSKLVEEAESLPFPNGIKQFDHLREKGAFLVAKDIIRPMVDTSNKAMEALKIGSKICAFGANFELAAAHANLDSTSQEGVREGKACFAVAQQALEVHRATLSVLECIQGATDAASSDRNVHDKLVKLLVTQLRQVIMVTQEGAQRAMSTAMVASRAFQVVEQVRDEASKAEDDLEDRHQNEDPSPPSSPSAEDAEGNDKDKDGEGKKESDSDAEGNDTWECDHCTHANAKKDAKCEMCEEGERPEGCGPEDADADGASKTEEPARDPEEFSMANISKRIRELQVKMWMEGVRTLQRLNTDIAKLQGDLRTEMRTICCSPLVGVDHVVTAFHKRQLFVLFADFVDQMCLDFEAEAETDRDAVTGGTTAPPEEGNGTEDVSGPWDCKVCTYTNQTASATACEMCTSSRAEVVEGTEDDSAAKTPEAPPAAPRVPWCSSESLLRHTQWMRTNTPDDKTFIAVPDDVRAQTFHLAAIIDAPSVRSIVQQEMLPRLRQCIEDNGTKEGRMERAQTVFKALERDILFAIQAVCAHGA